MTSLTALENIVDNGFDQNTETSIGFNSSITIADDTTLSIEVDLPTIEMTDEITCHWLISKLEFDWSFDASGTFADSVSQVRFTVETKTDNETSLWTHQSLETNVYRAPSVTTLNELEENNVEWDDIVDKIRINFTNIEKWQDTYYLNEITFYGAASSDCIACGEVTFYYWDFDASGMKY